MKDSFGHYLVYYVESNNERQNQHKWNKEENAEEMNLSKDQNKIHDQRLSISMCPIIEANSKQYLGQVSGKGLESQANLLDLELPQMDIF